MCGNHPLLLNRVTGWEPASKVWAASESEDTYGET